MPALLIEFGNWYASDLLDEYAQMRVIATRNDLTLNDPETRLLADDVRKVIDAKLKTLGLRDGVHVSVAFDLEKMTATVVMRTEG